MDLIFILKILWKKKWLLIIIPSTAAITAFFLAWDSKKMYRSTAQLSTGFTTNDRFNISGEKINIYEIDIKFNNLIETFKSPVIVGLLSYQLLLHDISQGTDPAFTSPETTAKSKIRLAPEEKTRAIEILKRKIENYELLTSFNPDEKKLKKILEGYEYDYDAIMRNLKVQRLNYSDYILVEYLSENPLLSAFVVNTISQEYIKFNNSRSSNLTGQSVDFYRNLVNNNKTILDEKTTALNNFKSQNNVVNVEVESETKFTQLAELEGKRETELSNVERSRLTLNSINNQLSSLGESSAAGSRGRDNVRIAELKNKIKEANTKYLNNNRDPAILSVVTELRNQLNAELSKQDNSGGGKSSDVRSDLLTQKRQAEIDLQVAHSNLNSLNSAIGRIKSNVTGLTTKGTTLNSLQREVEKANDEYLAAVDKYNAAQNEASVSTTSIKQVIAGQPATRPESSKLLIFTGLSGVVSFGFCLFLIIGLEYFDFSIKTPSHFIPSTSLDSLGYINAIKSDVITPETLVKKGSKDSKLIVFKELLKKLRFEVESSGGKIFLFTSTKNGEGKTSMIIALAHTLITNNKSVLVIDTNFKNNSLTRIFSAKPILETIATKELPVEEIVTKTNYKNLDLVGCKGGNYSPAEVFPDKKFLSLILKLNLNYDYIFLEGSSLNQYADTKELVAYVDRVIPVFAATSVIRPPDKESIAYLKTLKTKLMGSILNKVEVDNLEH